MDDLISRQAAIDAMIKLQTEDIEAYGASIPEGFDGDRAATALKALPSAQPECEDAVSREAVLNEIHRYMEERDYTIGLLDDNVCGLPPVTPKQPGWIQCSTEMPPTGKNVLVTLVDGAVTDGKRWKPQEGKWFLFSDGVNGLDEDVLAWMPLPAPAKIEV